MSRKLIDSALSLQIVLRKSWLSSEITYMDYSKLNQIIDALSFQNAYKKNRNMSTHFFLVEDSRCNISLSIMIFWLVYFRQFPWRWNGFSIMRMSINIFYCSNISLLCFTVIAYDESNSN